MTIKMDTIYRNLPVFLQNIAVSVKGFHFNYKRYGGSYKKYVNQLMRSQWLSTDDFFQLQQQELRKLIRECYDNIPYYKNEFQEFSNNIDSLALADLRNIPMLEKDILRKETTKFINEKRLCYGSDEGHTSGTSGIPLVWPYDLDSQQLNLAFRERQYRWAGITGRERSSRFSGRLIMGNHNSNPFWRHNYPENQWLFSVYHMTDNSLPEYYEALRHLDIQFLDGYPSALFNLAVWVNQSGLSGKWRPWAIFTTAETLFEFQRFEIEKAFGCKVFNFYSSSEGAPFVTQCEAGNMHFNPESGIIEFLRSDGSPAELGEEAEMVVTSFFQRTMPLIRYRIGDRGALSEEQNCPCRRKMPLIKYIGGRESDTLYTKEKGRVGSAGLSTAFYKIPGRLNAAQLEQIDEDNFVFRYVPMNEDMSAEEKSILLNEFRNRLGSSIVISIEKVVEVSKGKNGKHRLIVGMNNKDIMQ